MKTLITTISLICIACGVMAFQTYKKAKVISQNNAELLQLVTQHKTEDAAKSALTLGLLNDLDGLVKDAETNYTSRKDQDGIERVKRINLLREAIQHQYGYTDEERRTGNILIPKGSKVGFDGQKFTNLTTPDGKVYPLAK